MKKINFLFLIGMFFSFKMVSAQAGTWNCYANTMSINDIATEGNNFWLATDGGVVNLNTTDNSFFVYNKSNSHFRYTNAITGVVMSPNGTKWCANQFLGTSLYFMKDSIWERYVLPDSIDAGQFVVDKNSKLWMLCYQGVVSIDSNFLLQVVDKKTIPYLNTVYSYTDSDGTHQRVDSSHRFFSLAVDSNNKKIFVGGNYILEFNDTTWFQILNTNYNFNIIKSRGETIAMGGDSLGQNLIVRKNGVWTTYSIPLAIDKKRFLSDIEITESGDIYLIAVENNTNNSTLLKFSNGIFTTENCPNNIRKVKFLNGSLYGVFGYSFTQILDQGLFKKNRFGWVRITTDKKTIPAFLTESVYSIDAAGICTITGPFDNSHYKLNQKLEIKIDSSYMNCSPNYTSYLGYSRNQTTLFKDSFASQYFVVSQSYGNNPKYVTAKHCGDLISKDFYLDNYVGSIFNKPNEDWFVNAVQPNEQHVLRCLQNNIVTKEIQMLCYNYQSLVTIDDTLIYLTTKNSPVTNSRFLQKFINGQTISYPVSVNVTKIVKDSKNKIYTTYFSATRQRHVLGRFQNGSFVEYLIPGNPKEFPELNICVDDSDQIWVVSDEKISCLTKDFTWKSYPSIMEKFENRGNLFFYQPNGRLWINSTEGELYTFDTGQHPFEPDDTILIPTTVFDSLKVVPTPATNSFSFQLDSIYNQANVELYDMWGKMVFTANYSSTSQININRNGLVNGVYTLYVVGDNKKKFIGRVVFI